MEANNIEEESMTPTESIKSANSKPRRTRKSKAKQERDAEAYRRHNNKIWEETFLKPRIAAQRGEIVDFLPTPRPVDPPVMQIPVSADLIPELTHEVLNYATTSMKVTAQYDDEEVVRTVTALQMTAKTYYAAKNAHQEVEPTLAPVMKAIAENFDEAIGPLADYVSSVGKTEYEGQTIIPTMDESKLGYPLPNPVQNGYVVVNPEVIDIPIGHLVANTEHIDDDGRQLNVSLAPEHANIARNMGIISENDFTADFLLRPTHYLNQGLVPINVFYTGLHLENLAQRYSSLLSRMKRRVSTKIRKLGIKEGIGNLCQVIGVGDRDGLGRTQLWSLRKVDGHTVNLAGVFGFGKTPWHADMRQCAGYFYEVGFMAPLPTLASKLGNPN